MAGAEAISPGVANALAAVVEGDASPGVALLDRHAVKTAVATTPLPPLRKKARLSMDFLFMSSPLFSFTAKTRLGPKWRSLF